MARYFQNHLRMGTIPLDLATFQLSFELEIETISRVLGLFDVVIES